MIETSRLYIQPLTYEQLIKYISADNSLEKELQLNETSRTISIELKEALEETILPNVADKTKNYLYSTLWTIIWKEKNKMVGDLCFVGEPDNNGVVEIGYGIDEAFRNKNFMTEALSGVIEWAKKQATITTIIASTEKENQASFAVLLKNNFIKINEKDNLYHWQLKLK